MSQGMLAARREVKMFRAHNADHSISGIARTLNAAFSSDPLIQWLRPNAEPWAQANKEVMEWQKRRIQSIMLNGTVFQSASVEKMASEYPRRSTATKPFETSEQELKKPGQGSHCEELIDRAEADDAGAIFFLFPPENELKWSLSRLILRFKVWLLNICRPVNDEGGNMERVDKLMAMNGKSLKLLREEYKQKLWYLEVVAVHPCLQSRGIGGAVMNWILEHVHKQPIYLECTQKSNIAFYENFGFRVIDEVKLTDGDSDDENATVTYWGMIRTEQD